MKKTYLVSLCFLLAGLTFLLKCGSSSKEDSSSTATSTTSAIPIPELRCGGQSCLQ